MDSYEEMIMPEVPKALPNEQLFIYVPIGTIDNPGIVTFDDVDFRIDEHGRVYMKASSTQNAKDIDVLEAARPVTGSFSVGDALWGKTDDGYTATIALTENPLQSGDLMLILPDGEATRKASADVVVSVKSAENGDQADAIVLTAKSKPAVTTLWYRYAVIKRGAKDNTMLPVASIVGVNDVPEYIKDAIETEEPTSVDLSGFAPNENGKGSIVETYADRTVVTELTYDDTGRIIKIGDTTLEWGEEE